jgi:hypothetical protein
MKKLILLLLGIFTVGHIEATHVIGGAITWECATNGTYVFTLTLIRDCTGAAAPNGAVIITNNAGVTIAGVAVSSQYVNPNCNAPICNSGALGFGYSGAFQVIKYKSAPIYIAGTPPPQGWIFSWDICCRPTMQNLTGQGNIHIESKMFAYPGVINHNPCLYSSVQYADNPLMVFCTGKQEVAPVPFQNNSGDSVYYSLTYVKTSTLIPAQYAAGYSAFHPVGQNGGITDSLTLHGQTGIMQFLTGIQGIFATAVSAKTFRNGHLISDVVAEFPILTKPCTPPAGICSTPNTLSQVSLGWLPNSDTLSDITPTPFSFHNNYRHHYANPKLGDTLRFNLYATDFDLNPNCSAQVMTIKAYGARMSADSLYASNTQCPGGYPCATLTSLNSTGSFIAALSNSVQFELPITCDLVAGHNQHVFYFEITTNNCPLPTTVYYTLTVKVDDELPSQPIIDTVNSAVLANGDIFLQWSPPTNLGFGFSYYLIWHSYNNSTLQILDTLFNVADTNYLHTSTASGNHTYHIMAVGGCLNTSDSVMLLNSPSISLKSNIGIPTWVQHIKIYPQPMSDVLIISGTENILGATLELMDNAGRVLMRDKIDNPTRQELDVKALPKGLYVILIKNGDYTHALRLVK